MPADRLGAGVVARRDEVAPQVDDELDRIGRRRAR
jgi:hypothetical protein